MKSTSNKSASSCADEPRSVCTTASGVAVIHVLARLLQRLERFAPSSHATLYRFVAMRLSQEFTAAGPDADLDGLLALYPASAELHENTVEAAGLRRTARREGAMAARCLALEAIRRASAKAGVEGP